MEVLELFNNGRKSAESTLYVHSCQFYFLQFMACLLHYLIMYSFSCMFSTVTVLQFVPLLFPVTVLKRAHTSCLYYASDQDNC